MPRLPRAECEPGIHHVFSRGNRRQQIYLDDADRQRYLAMLGGVTLRMNWSCLGFCLMGNHVHLFIETRTPNLSCGMHRLHGAYAQYFNRRHGFSGHLVEDRFKAVPVNGDRQFVTLARYLARNPVEAGLCSRAEDWPWSSYAAVIRRRTPYWLDTSALSAYLGTGGGSPVRVYTELVNF